VSAERSPSTDNASPAAIAQAAPAARAGSRAELLHTAKDPFTSGLNITGVIAAVIFGALAVLIATMRRTSDPREAPAELPETECEGAQP
jgi:DHA2 family multidrug resistance protein-like MFS transporter